MILNQNHTFRQNVKLGCSISTLYMHVYRFMFP